VAELPDLVQVATERRGDGLRVVALSMDGAGVGPGVGPEVGRDQGQGLFHRREIGFGSRHVLQRDVGLAVENGDARGVHLAQALVSLVDGLDDGLILRVGGRLGDLRAGGSRGVAEQGQRAGRDQAGGGE